MHEPSGLKQQLFYLLRTGTWAEYSFAGHLLHVVLAGHKDSWKVQDGLTHVPSRRCWLPARSSFLVSLWLLRLLHSIMAGFQEGAFQEG